MDKQEPPQEVSAEYRSVFIREVFEKNSKAVEAVCKAWENSTWVTKALEAPHSVWG